MDASCSNIIYILYLYLRSKRDSENSTDIVRLVAVSSMMSLTLEKRYCERRSGNFPLE